MESSSGKKKFELVNCPKGGASCSSQLYDINRNFENSDIYLQNKEYLMSVESLKMAFEKTYELEDSKCRKCSQLFRSTIINSLENMHVELERMASKRFRGQRFQGSYILVDNALRNLKEKEH